jgi:hypothetical protein
LASASTASSEEFRASARDDSDLDPIRDEPAFRQLVPDERPEHRIG